MLRLFDFPDPNITSGGRVETTVPLQQLFVLNSEFMVANARAVASRLWQAVNTRGRPRRRRAASARPIFLLFGRPPTERERKLGLLYLAADRRAPARPRADMSRFDRYAQALLATNEFLFVD